MSFAARVMLATLPAMSVLPAAAQQTTQQQAAPGDARWLRDEQSGCTAPDPKFADGDGIVWLGACPNGVIDGDGTLTFLNNGQPQVTIAGAFDEGNLESGHATLSWPDGSKYDGQQIGGIFNGQGVFVSAQQDRLEGNWKNGALNGNASVTWANGNHYEGGWSDGKAEGHGVETWANGDRYDGDWHAGEAQGHGMQVWANGQRYEGEWQKDMPNGTGTLTRSDGSHFAGKFVDGHPVGEAAEATPPGPQQVTAKAAPTAEPTAQALPAEPLSSPTQNSATQGAANNRLSQIEGKKLTAVDGSSIALAAADGGFTRQITKADGASAITDFTFVNERMGTVSTSSDPDHATGLFKMTDDEIDIDYADGRSEVFKPALGGVTLMLHTPTGGNFCMAWYPEGHVFSENDRKAALADYASKLGVSIKRNTRAAKQVSPCVVTPAIAAPTAPIPANTTMAGVKNVPHPLPRPIQASYEIQAPAAPNVIPRPAPADPARVAVLASPNPAVPALATVEVRNSQVHLIDAPRPNIPNFAGGQFEAPAANTAKAPAALPNLPQQAASAPQSAAGVPSAASAPAIVAAAVGPYQPDFTDSGASSCLSVASDGNHWGFKNSCSAAVQFAYCLKGDAEVLAACKNGVIGGSVAPNSFSALVSDASMKEKSVDHQFRWVACSGGAGEVIPKLDNYDPPIGRCLRARAAAN
jgi:hypothetical protein